MTVLRREDVQSRGASWDGGPYRMSSSPILAIVPLIIRRLRGPSPIRVLVSLTDPVLTRRAQAVTKPVPVRVGAPPRGSRPTHAQWRPRSWVRAYVVPPGVG